MIMLDENKQKTVRATQIIQSFPYSENGGKVTGIFKVLLDPPAFAAVFAPIWGSLGLTAISTK
jgi:hypothetical protein